MEKYEYKVVTIDWSMWTGKAKTDYLEVLNELGEQGFRFITFAPHYVKAKGQKGIDIIFEKRY